MGGKANEQAGGKKVEASFKIYFEVKKERNKGNKTERKKFSRKERSGQGVGICPGLEYPFLLVEMVHWPGKKLR